mmetsp:Transcript_126629/g.289609  ORF Transcript_126629/g.289609 Transcript_126629/m.289609 type:complete len:252 (+) Transcript_126629:240-995(+)
MQLVVGLHPGSVGHHGLTGVGIRAPERRGGGGHGDADVVALGEDVRRGKQVNVDLVHLVLDQRGRLLGVGVPPPQALDTVPDEHGLTAKKPRGHIRNRDHYIRVLGVRAEEDLSRKPAHHRQVLRQGPRLVHQHVTPAVPVPLVRRPAGLDLPHVRQVVPPQHRGWVRGVVGVPLRVGHRGGGVLQNLVPVHVQRLGGGGREVVGRDPVVAGGAPGVAPHDEVVHAPNTRPGRAGQVAPPLLAHQLNGGHQ